MVREAFFWSLLIKHIVIRISLMKEPPPPRSFEPQGINMEKEPEVFWLFGKIAVLRRGRVSKTQWYCYAIASFAVS